MLTTLKAAILASGSHQYQLAKRTGITETRLSRLVTGRDAPTADERRALADALGVAEEDLFSGRARPSGGGCHD